MKNKILYILFVMFIVIVLMLSVFIVYYLSGGDFERGAKLGFTSFAALSVGIIAISFSVLAKIK